VSEQNKTKKTFFPGLELTAERLLRLHETFLSFSNQQSLIVKTISHRYHRAMIIDE
jgi:hypothetical protein